MHGNDIEDSRRATRATGSHDSVVSRDNVELVAAALEALNARDTEAAARLLHEDVEWRPLLTAGGALEGSVYRGPESVARYMEDLDEVFLDTHIETISLESAAPDRVLFEGRVTARGRESGVPLDVQIWAAWEIRDGKGHRGTAYWSRAEALDALGER
jgi:ketosteroid isomerase-like protein